MRIKKVIVFILCFVLLIACNSEKNNGVRNEEDSVIIDCLNRSVSIPDKVETIAALDPQIATFLIMFGAGDQVVAVPGGVQRNFLLQELSPSLGSISVPLTSGALNFEEMALLKPDIVFIKKENYTSSFSKDLDQLGIPVIVVESRSMQDQVDNVKMLTQFVNGEALDRALAYISFYEKTIDVVQEKSQQVPIDKRVSVFHSVNQAVRTNKSPSLSTDWLEAVGTHNVVLGESLKESKSSFDATIEQLFIWNPDVILTNEVETREYILTNQRWIGLSALEDNQVYQLPIGVSRWGHQSSTEIPLAMLWMGKHVYPNIYEDIDLYEECRTFYKDVVGIELNEELYRKILSGEGIRISK